MASKGVRLHYVTVDYAASSLTEPDRKLLEGWLLKTGEPMLDGPVTRRLAIIDIDPATGALVPGARFEPAAKGRQYGRYAIADQQDHAGSDFQQVSVFTTVLAVMAMFEEPDVLGRPLRWAFDGEQLLVVPRAGRMANAFYHRDSRSLQFFFFDALAPDGTSTHEIFTCLSPDIIAHEATHAILDGIAPDLFSASSPQSIALHEAIADIGAVMFALRTDSLRKQTLKIANGDLRNPGAFNSVAEVFGRAVNGSDRPLRDLHNSASLKPDAHPPVNKNRPHDLSTVLSGALYALLVEAHGRTKIELVDAMKPAPDDRNAALFSASGKALFKAGEKLKRIVFRALDYLPPGEISFADYGRAVIAADTASNPEPSWERDFLKEEFVRRGIVAAARELDPVVTDLVIPHDLDLDELVADDVVARRFVEANRDALMIPPDLDFELRPRLDVTKTTWRHEIGQTTVREAILKVAWRQTQLIEKLGVANAISVSYGTTLAIDWNARTVRALLSTSQLHPSQTHDVGGNADMRKAYIANLAGQGLLDAASAEVVDGVLQLHGAGQLLHVCGETHV
ncbi:hypothetical protein [Bosea sp. (in: a-proteobacteria)]|jgi:hypothetical protein|uniref:hypothetical protein n=1 Tax=Bosea sp. (in: a-proteobacteria) TaxID=1871050 RepID=UPI00356AA9F6